MKREFGMCFIPFSKICPKPQSKYAEFFGNRSNFEICNISKAMEKVENQGRTLDFPVLSPRVATALYSR